jgi:hypothetical protein
MEYILNKYIDDYVEKTKSDTDKETARHLKEIIPKTTHLNKAIYNEVIEELLKEIANGNNFKDVFFGVCKKFLLKGDIIKAELPDILTRIIANKNRFVEKILYQYKRSPSQHHKLKMVFASGDKVRIIRTLRKLRRVGLSGWEVVFAGFDEKNEDRDPYLKHRVIDIINQLALDKDVFDDPYTVVKIRYRNDDDFDKRYPMFIEAGWNDKFHPSDESDDYGRTKSLDPSLPGIPEVVHENMKLSEVIMEDVDFLEDN